MFGPQRFFGEGTYTSNGDGTARRYYAPVPWSAMVKTIQWAINIKDFTTNAQLALSLEYTFDGEEWFSVSLEGGTSTTGWHQSSTEADFGNRTRLVLSVEATSGTAIVSANVKGAYLSGKPF